MQSIGGEIMRRKLVRFISAKLVRFISAKNPLVFFLLTKEVLTLILYFFCSFGLRNLVFYATDEGVLLFLEAVEGEGVSLVS